jgi:RNA polymerase sigma factor (sigma-70 family)
MTRSRDETADRLTATLERESAGLLRHLERRLGHDAAADALADVMLAAWRHVAKLPHEDEQARMWLYGIARNVVANSQRSDRRHSGLADRLRSALSTGGRTAQPADAGADVRDAIDRLSPAHAELVRLIHWDGFTITEASQIVGITASTGRTRYQRARTELRLALGQPDPPPATDTHLRAAAPSPQA